jgi:hypothetical protein
MNLTALADQVDAAERDAHQRWTAVLQPQSGSPLPAGSAGARRVRHGLTAAVLGLATGTTRMCAQVFICAAGLCARCR